jgi:hypothetical protein
MPNQHYRSTKSSPSVFHNRAVAFRLDRIISDVFFPSHAPGRSTGSGSMVRGILVGFGQMRLRLWRPGNSFSVLSLCDQSGSQGFQQRMLAFSLSRKSEIPYKSDIRISITDLLCRSLVAQIRMIHLPSFATYLSLQLHLQSYYQPTNAIDNSHKWINVLDSAKEGLLCYSLHSKI